MKVPLGTKLASHKLVDISLADLIEKVKQEKTTGYIRLTAEKAEELYDFYLLFLKGEVVGAFSESKKEQIFGDKAYKSAFLRYERGVMDVRTLEEGVISLLMGNYPEARVSSSAIPEIPQEDEIPKDTRILRIANMIIPYGDLRDFHLSVEVTDFWELLSDIERDSFTGYFRVFAEEGETPRDGCVFFSKGEAKGALYESEAEVKYGDEALFRILFTFSLEKGVIDFHELEPRFLKIVLKQSALKLSGTPQEVFHRIEEEELEVIRKARSYFGIPEGEQVISSQVKELAALEILLRTLKDRALDGYLVMSSHRGAGILIVEAGAPRAALYLSGTQELTAGQALEGFLDQIQEETSVKIFILSPEEVKGALGREEASIKASDSVSEAIVQELGEDFFVEISEAHRFKEEFQKRRKRATK